MESLFDNGQPIIWQSDVGNRDKEGRLFNILNSISSHTSVTTREKHLNHRLPFFDANVTRQSGGWKACILHFNIDSQKRCQLCCSGRQVMVTLKRHVFSTSSHYGTSTIECGRWRGLMNLYFFVFNFNGISTLRLPPC